MRPWSAWALVVVQVSLAVAMVTMGTLGALRDSAHNERAVGRILGLATRCSYEAERSDRRVLSEPAVEPEYILWEVHEVSIRYDPRDPSQDYLLPMLCKTIGDPSALRLEAELGAYSLWTDRLGKQKLGCRWIKKKDP